MEGQVLTLWGQGRALGTARGRARGASGARPLCATDFWHVGQSHTEACGASFFLWWDRDSSPHRWAPVWSTPAGICLGSWWGLHPNHSTSFSLAQAQRSHREWWLQSRCPGHWSGWPAWGVLNPLHRRASLSWLFHCQGHQRGKIRYWGQQVHPHVWQGWSIRGPPTQSPHWLHHWECSDEWPWWPAVLQWSTQGTADSPRQRRPWDSE